MCVQCDRKCDQCFSASENGTQRMIACFRYAKIRADSDSDHFMFGTAGEVFSRIFQPPLHTTCLQFQKNDSLQQDPHINSSKNPLLFEQLSQNTTPIDTQEGSAKHLTNKLSNAFLSDCVIPLPLHLLADTDPCREVSEVVSTARHIHCTFSYAHIFLCTYTCTETNL